MGPHTRHLRFRIAAALLSALPLTFLVSYTSVLPFGAHDRTLHVALETAATLIAALAAVLVHGRYVRSLQRRDLVLTAALAVFAAANFALSLLPALLTGGAESPLAWAAVLARALGAALLAAAALMPAGRVRSTDAAAGRWLAACLLALGVMAAAVLGFGESLPAPVAPGAEPGELFLGTPLLTALDAAIMVMFGGAALGFTRRAAETDDGLLGWLAVAAVFGTFTWLNYTIYPSVLTDWFAAGDVLRVASFVCLLAGGVAEVRVGQRALTVAAVVDERQRIAGDLHDGTAQELAFILQAARAMPAGEDREPALEQIVAAAQHALDNTRLAIAGLAHPGDEPLIAALGRTAREVAGRDGARAQVAGPIGLHVPPATREELCRLVREAVTNAVRHGGARTVRVTVEETPELRVHIEDDGRGFVAAPPPPGHFGLRGMGQRVARLGGELRISSQPGEGTEVLVVLP